MPGGGARALLETADRFNRELAATRGMRFFLAQEQERALRILTSSGGIVQPRAVGAIEALILEEEQAGRYEPTVAPNALAYAIVRLGEAFLYNDAIVGIRGDTDRLREIEGALLGVDPPSTEPPAAGVAPRGRIRSTPASAPHGANPAMTRLSEYLLPTEKQPPADAEAISHKLMVRAGLIRQLGAGMWSWLPAGWRVHQRAVAIVREEMDAIGGQEMLMPVLQPAEPWRKTGRLQIDELFKLTDRKGSELVLAMTHEEAVTTHVAQVVRSYRDLPLILYHFQVKERDEPRPRAGVLRTREFIMKDSYSFDRDRAGLDERYELHVGAYDRIMERTGLRFYRVESDVGMMGGLGAHEYMAPCPAGEDRVALADGYAANLEVALEDPDVRQEGERLHRAASRR